MPSLTRDLGAFVAGVRYEDIPPEAVQTIMTAIADTLSVAVAGAREEGPQTLARALASGGSESTLLTGGRASAVDAALVNGTAAHALDYDDVALKGSHPSAVLVPAILAEAQALNSSGRDMITAYAAGYEVWADLIAREKGNYQRKGWHPTGIFGAIGAAAACASLHRLKAKAATNALGAAASQASGVMSNLGSMVKPTHPGHAAACGIYAARFAEAGRFEAKIEFLAL